MLAELLQPAFRSSQPRATAACDESRVCEILAAVVQRNDVLRAQAEAQQHAAINQWAEGVQRDMHQKVEELSEHIRQLQSQQQRSIQSANNERNQQMARQSTQLSEQQTQHDTATTEMSKRLSAVESSVEQLITDAERRAETGYSGSDSDVEQALPSKVTESSEKASTASHSSDSEVDEVQRAEDEAEEDEEDEEGEVESSVDELPARANSDEKQVREVDKLVSSSSPARSPAVDTFRPPSDLPPSALPWSSPFQPSVVYSRRATAQRLSQPNSQLPPSSSSPPLHSSPSLADQPRGESAPRKRPRRRTEIALLAQPMSGVEQAIAYNF